MSYNCISHVLLFVKCKDKEIFVGINNEQLDIINLTEKILLIKPHYR